MTDLETWFDGPYNLLNEPEYTTIIAESINPHKETVTVKASPTAYIKTDLIVNLGDME